MHDPGHHKPATDRAVSTQSSYTSKDARSFPSSRYAPLRRPDAIDRSNSRFERPARKYFSIARYVLAEDLVNFSPFGVSNDGSQNYYHNIVARRLFLRVASPSGDHLRFSVGRRAGPRGGPGGASSGRRADVRVRRQFGGREPLRRRETQRPGPGRRQRRG